MGDRFFFLEYPRRGGGVLPGAGGGGEAARVSVENCFWGVANFFFRAEIPTKVSKAALP